MRRLLTLSVLAVALAGMFTVGPSIATPETAPRAKAAAPNAAWIFYGPWLCEKATGYWAYPRGVYGPEVSPPGSYGGRVFTPGNAVRVSPVWLNYPSRVDGTILCPHSWPPARAMGVTVPVNVSGVRTFRFSGDAHWMNTWDIKK